MKFELKLILVSCLLLLGVFVNAQNVGVNKSDPEKDLDVVGNVRIDKTGSSGTSPQLELKESGSRTNFTRLKFTKAFYDDYWMVAARPKDSLTTGRFNIYNPDLGNALSIYENGAVGINQSVPAAMLHVNSKAGIDPLRVQRNGSTKFRIFDDSSISIGTNNENVTPGDVYIHTNLGIGVSAPAFRLDVNGAIKSSGLIMADNPTIGHVLTSDANGKATWQPNDESVTNEAINLFSFASNIISIREGSNPIQQINLSSLALDDNLGNHTAEFNLNLNNKKITNLATPTLSSDAATKAYVDANAGGGGSSIEDADGNTKVEINTNDEILFSANGSSIGTLDERNFELSFGNSGSLFIGNDAGANMSLTATSKFNIGIGPNALQTTTTSFGNIAIGVNALQDAGTNGSNVAIGLNALTNLNTGTDCVAIGLSAMNSSTGSDHCVSIGANSMSNGSDYSIAIGSEAKKNSTGFRSIGVGYKASFNQDGNDNIVIGSEAMSSATGSGGQNITIGSYAALNNGAGDSNVAIGHRSMQDNSLGDDNVSIGFEALKNITGSGNTAVGYRAGLNMVNGSNTTSIGNNTNQSTVAGGQINITAIGNGANNTAGNQVRLGNSSVGSIGGFANWSNVSDERFKKNVSENVVGLAFIKQLRPVTYNLDLHAIDDWFAKKHNFRDSSLTITGYQRENIQYTGFIAQEVETSAASLGYTFSGVDKPKNDSDYYGLRYAEFVVPLVKSVQELSDELNVQKALNDTLQEIVSNQEALILDLIQRVEVLEAKQD